MSKISVTPNASGTANFTIASPATNTDRTLTLPDNTGTILTSASNTNFPAGSVLQVVQGTYSTLTSIANTSYVDTGLSASITPTSSSSKILVLTSQQGFLRLDASTEQEGYLNLMRGATQITLLSCAQRMTGSAGQYASFFGGIIYLDSPNTTSSTTYKTQAKVANTASAGTIYFQGGSGTSTITLLEIKA